MLVDKLCSIRTTADHFDLPVSTLHYWERRGLITPHRRGGRRYYDTDQLYRIAAIRHWRDIGRFSLEEIGVLLAGRTATHDWLDTVSARISLVDKEIKQLERTGAYLRHLLTCRQDVPERCATFRAEQEIPSA
ncbi:MerR family transcriptional regulator [Crossiella cryophila]|uniref:DNA-binding transcriptional MerR regulator n=1 Tax=Crossiella cryophila TaxID=43355 RepID=A0A7W7CC00_9PSEU|nr:MerR family transcriptional regulator [Crossiella cryophila]MBB4678212.1 DNA-binding transcriptional MerR regulator [Crossiella cryophila]